MDCNHGGHSYPDSHGKCVECGKPLVNARVSVLNNVQIHKDRIELLEGEIITYRMTLEGISMGAKLNAVLQSKPLLGICEKALREGEGLEIAKEFTLLKMFEDTARQEMILASKRPDEKNVMEFQMWAQAMNEITQGQIDLLQSLNDIRLKARQREASRIIMA